MSTEPLNRQRDGKVVQLRAAEADTEVQLDEGRPAGRRLRRPHRRRRASAARSSRSTGVPGRTRSGTSASPPPGTGTGPRTTGSAHPAYFAKAARVRRLGRGRRHPAPDRLVAHPGHVPAGVPGRRGRPAQRSPAAAQGRARRPASSAARSSRSASPGWPSPSCAMVVFAPLVGAGRWPPSPLFVAFALAGRPQGKTITTQRRAARRRAAADPGRDHPRARARWASPRSTRRIRKGEFGGRTSPAPSARTGRAGGSRSTCPTA